MKLRLQTDYALRTLMYLGFVDRKAKAEEIAGVFDISKDHLVKVIQQLVRSGLVRTTPGRGGGVELTRDPGDIRVKEVVEEMEGRHGILDCVPQPEVCPLEPGCRLRRLLITAEDAFYDALADTTIGDLCRRGQRGGLKNLEIST